MNFGEKLRMLREERNLTQTDLAGYLNLTKANISRYELGTRQPNIETIYKIAEFFNVSIDWLFGRSIIRPFSSANNTPRSFNSSDLEILEYLKLTPHVYDMLNEFITAPESRVRMLTRIWKDINIDI